MPEKLFLIRSPSSNLNRVLCGFCGAKAEKLPDEVRERHAAWVCPTCNAFGYFNKERAVVDTWVRTSGDVVSVSEVMVNGKVKWVYRINLDKDSEDYLSYSSDWFKD